MKTKGFKQPIVKGGTGLEAMLAERDWRVLRRWPPCKPGPSVRFWVVVLSVTVPLDGGHGTTKPTFRCSRKPGKAWKYMGSNKVIFAHAKQTQTMKNCRILYWLLFSIITNVRNIFKNK